MNARISPPSDPGWYVVYAPSMDPDKPLLAIVEWNGTRWLLPDVWNDAVTHYSKFYGA